MCAAQKAPTLYEDWLIRRDRLAATARGPADRRRIELRLLEFLLAHYRGSAEAAQPARFPVRSELYLDRRAIVVHNHLGKGYLSDVHTREQAEARVRGVLARMTIPAETLPADRPLFDPASPPTYSEKLEGIRGRLSEGRADMRMCAAVELGRFGTLDDIGLLSDLLGQPAASDEDPYERHVLMTAMKKIVRRLTGELPSEEVPAEESLTGITADLPAAYEPLLLTFYVEPRRSGEWIVIGTDWGCEFRVNAAGTVYSIDPAGEKRTRLVNSSVRQLARFLEEHQELVVVRRLSERFDRRFEINAFRQRLEAIDPAAFSDTENWWAVMVEQMQAF